MSIDELIKEEEQIITSAENIIKVFDSFPFPIQSVSSTVDLKKHKFILSIYKEYKELKEKYG